MTDQPPPKAQNMQIEYRRFLAVVRSLVWAPALHLRILGQDPSARLANFPGFDRVCFGLINSPSGMEPAGSFSGTGVSPVCCRFPKAPLRRLNSDAFSTLNILNVSSQAHKNNFSGLSRNNPD
jgi:hypothetical protein